MMKMDYNLKFLWMICLVAAMGGLLFGYDWVVIGGAKPFYEAFYELTGEDQAWRAGWAMSSATQSSKKVCFYLLISCLTIVLSSSNSFL